jgi:hypothetical protein
LTSERDIKIMADLEQRAQEVAQAEAQGIIASWNGLIPEKGYGELHTSIGVAIWCQCEKLSSLTRQNIQRAVARQVWSDLHGAKWNEATQ